MASTPDNNTLTPATRGRKQLLTREESRARKLRRIAQQVKKGTYKVDTEAVAEHVLHKGILPATDTDRH